MGGREIGFLFGQYKKLTNRFHGVLTGKGVEYGGSWLRREATGYGLVYFAQEMLATRGEGLEGKTALVSGSGNVAQYTVEKLLQLGAKPITLSDSNGTIYDPAGIDEEKLAWVIDLKENRRGRIAEYAQKFRSVQYFPDRKPWGIKADLAFPCATQNEIDEEDAKALVANGVKCVAEGANMPTTPGGVHTFLQARILYGPGKAANAGGVAVSGLEMNQNNGCMKRSQDEVDCQLRAIMRSIHASCVRYGKQPDGFVNYVVGANIAGFIKVANAMLAQGLV